MKSNGTLKPNDAKRIQRNYERVKGFIQHAQLAFRTGDIVGGMRRSIRGFKLARENADLLRGTTAEPIRSHMHFVAAALAMDLKKYDRVIEMVERAQEGNPPEQIAKDLARLRQAAMQARIHSNGEGNGDARHGGGKEPAAGENSGPEIGDESRDCEAGEPESGNGEPVRPRDLHG